MIPTSGSQKLPTYENMARAMGVDLGGWSFGAQFGDFNNDGFVDLYVVNGYVSASRNESYWYDYSKVAGGHQIVIGDAANWPAMGERSLAGYQPKKVWINDGGGGFVDVAQMVGAPRSAVSESASTLREKGIIDYRRGVLTIRNAKRLHKVACECFDVVSHSANGGNGRSG